MIFYKRVQKYFTKHPMENAAAHLFLGMGAGFLFTYPLAGAHPVRWGAVFVLLGLGMHIKAMR